MQVLNDIMHWALLENGKGIEFPSKRARNCTLDFNVAGKAAVYIKLASEKTPRLLAWIEGRDTVKFVTDGAYTLINKSEDVDVYVLTRDGTIDHRVAVDVETYTVLHTPRVVDENLQAVMEHMNKSINRRMAAQQAQFERELALARQETAVVEPRPVGNDAAPAVQSVAPAVEPVVERDTGADELDKTGV